MLTDRPQTVRPVASRGGADGSSTPDTRDVPEDRPAGGGCQSKEGAATEVDSGGQWASAARRGGREAGRRSAVPDDHSVGAVSWWGAGEDAGHAPPRAVLPRPGRQGAPRPGSPSRPRRLLLGRASSLGRPAGCPVRPADGCRPSDHLGVVPDGRPAILRVTVDRRRAPGVFSGRGPGDVSGKPCPARSPAFPHGSVRCAGAGCRAHPGCRGGGWSWWRTAADAARVRVRAAPARGPSPTGPHPTTTDFATTDPAAADPATTDPATTDPATTDPATTDSTTTDF